MKISNEEIILNEINNSKNVLLVSHAKPDGDTIGSALALSHYLDHKKIKHDLFCIDKPADYFSYLPKLDQYKKHNDNVDFTKYDKIICVDHGDIKQSKVEDYLHHAKNYNSDLKIINIDHHHSNNNFGDINFVKKDASSTCEAIYHIFKKNNVNITKQIATCLLTGIITDTGNFTNSATNDSSLQYASELTRKGARIPKIEQQVIRNKNIPSLNLWGEVFERLTFIKKYKLAYTIITREDFEENNLNIEAIDGLINFLNGIESVNVVLLLVQEKDNLIKGSLRTTKDTIDLTKLASIWGGGGHKKASGFKIKGNLVKVNDYWQVV